jgi:hypothetical protein
MEGREQVDKCKYISVMAHIHNPMARNDYKSLGILESCANF